MIVSSNSNHKDWLFQRKTNGTINCDILQLAFIVFGLDSLVATTHPGLWDAIPEGERGLIHIYYLVLVNMLLDAFTKVYSLLNESQPFVFTHSVHLFRLASFDIISLVHQFKSGHRDLYTKFLFNLYCPFIQTEKFVFSRKIWAPDCFPNTSHVPYPSCCQGHQIIPILQNR